jgi:hypothetical protein
VEVTGPKEKKEEEEEEEEEEEAYLAVGRCHSRWQKVLTATERKRPERYYNAYLLFCLSSVFQPSLLFCASFLALYFSVLFSGYDGSAGSSWC